MRNILDRCFKVRYLLKSIFLVFVVFPAILFGLMILTSESLRGHSDIETAIVLLFFSCLIGSLLGTLLGRENDLPGHFVPRYWPLLAPMVIILVSRIYFNIFETELHYSHGDILTVVLAFYYIPLLLSFILNVPPEKKLAKTRWGWSTCAFIVVLFSVIAWQARLDFGKTQYEYYSGATVADYHTARFYCPWGEDIKLVSLDVPASLLLSGDFPKVGGAMELLPIYAAAVNETYKADDKKELAQYLNWSYKMPDDLISGERDVIFVFQPSDEQLEAAKKAGLELSLTPIAKEAFVFFVNAGNPVSDLSIGQIQDIYLKKITNWRQVGGRWLKILPFQHPEKSVSQTAMIKEVMKDKKLPPPLQADYPGWEWCMTYHDIAQYQDREGAIGYLFRFFTHMTLRYEYSYKTGFIMYPRFLPAEPVKLLSISGVAPTEENIRNGSYPFTEDILAVTAGTSNPHVKELIDWLLSPQGQELIEKNGYVGVR